MSKQNHDLGRRKRKASEPIRKAAELRRMALKSMKKEPADWYKQWLRTTHPRYPFPTREVWKAWERETRYG